MKLRPLASTVVAAFVAVMMLSGPAAVAQLAGESSVTGTGATADGVFSTIVVDAHAGPGGVDPNGTVSFSVQNTFTVAGPVTCLAVDGNRAVIGFNDVSAGFGPITVEIVDNGPNGTPPDSFDAAPSPTSCTGPTGVSPRPLGSGDFVVRETPPLTSKDQCKDGGWRNFTDDHGQTFTNQGQCIRFVVARNLPKTTTVDVNATATGSQRITNIADLNAKWNVDRSNARARDLLVGKQHHQHRHRGNHRWHVDSCNVERDGDIRDIGTFDDPSVAGRR